MIAKSRILKRSEESNQIQELEMNIERAQMVRHNIYEIENFYPTIIDKQFKDKLNMRLTEIVASNIDFVIGSLAPATKQYTPTEINEMKEKVENIYKLSKNNQPSTYFYSSKHSKIRGIEYGRLFSKESLQGLKREIRNTIVDKENCVDIDMVNAHPCIMNQVASLLHVNAPVLNEYVTDRERLLRTIGTDCHESAKEIPLAIINGGIRSSLHPTISWLKGLEDEIQDIYKAFIQTQIGSEISADVHRRDPDNYNKLGSTLNLLLCKIENEILSQCVFYCQSKNIEVYTLCFDGFIASRTDDSILAELENHVYTTLGLRMRFSIKSFDKCLSDDLIQQLLNISIVDISNTTFIPCKRLNDNEIKEISKKNVTHGIARNLLKNELFQSEKVIQEYIINWINQIYKININKLSFDGNNFILKSSWRNGKIYKCFCSNPECNLIGDITFQINPFGLKMITASCSFAPFCAKYVDITDSMGIPVEVLSYYNDEIFDAKTNYFQSKYSCEGVEVINYTSTEKINLTKCKSDIIIQSGYAGYGKTANVMNYMNNRFMSTRNNINVIISNLSVQNRHYEKDERLNHPNNINMPIIHCMGKTIENYSEHLILKRKNNIGVSKEHAEKYRFTGHNHTYIVNSRSLQDCLKLPKIDMLFIDEFIQVLRAVSDIKDKRNISLYNVLIYLIKIAKKIFISDIVFDTELINLIKLIRSEGNNKITHYQICNTHMKCRNITFSDNVQLLRKLLDSDKPKYIFSNSKKFIDWAYEQYQNIFGKEKCLKIVGKSPLQSIDKRLDEIDKLFQNTENIPYIFCSPAVLGAISIWGKRDVIGVRVHKIVHKTDFINGLLRARNAEDVYLFNFVNEYFIKHDSDSYILNGIEKSMMAYIRKLSDNISLLDLLSKTICKIGKFDIIMTYGNCFQELAEIGIDFKPDTHPEIQIWISDRSGLKIVDAERFNHVMSKISERIEPINSNYNEIHQEMHIKERYTFVFLETQDKKLYFKINNEEYLFDDVTKIIKLVHMCNEEYTEDADDDTIDSISNKYSFIFYFYSMMEPIKMDIKRIVKQNRCEIIGTNNFTQAHIEEKKMINQSSLIPYNRVANMQYEYEKMLKILNNTETTVDQYANQIMAIYKIGMSDKFTISLIKITKTITEIINGNETTVEHVMGKVTNHTEWPFNYFTKDRYTHDEIEEFMRMRNIKKSDRRIHNLIHYQLVSKKMTVAPGKRQYIQTLIKLTKDKIKVEIFNENN